MTAPRDHGHVDLQRFVRALRRRVRLTRVAAALLAGAATMAIVLVAMAMASPLAARGALVPAAAAGALVGAALIWRWKRDWAPAPLVARAEAALPGLQNHLVTALELAAHPERASDRVRAHVTARAVRLVGESPVDLVESGRRALLFGAGAALCAAAAVWIAIADPLPKVTRRSGSTAAVTRGAAPATIARVDAVVTPPAYVGRASTSIANPERVDLLAGSSLVVRVTSGAASVAIELGSAAAAVAREGSEVQRATLTPAASGVLTLTARRADGELVDRRLIPIVVRPDAPPEVSIERPGADLAFETAAARVAIAARASDDLGLAALTLHYTKVTGSGEQYAFREGALPLAITRDSATVWRGAVTRALASLDLHDGDLLVYYASAADRRPGAERAVSDSYVIEIGKPHTAIAGGFAVPLEEDKAAISMSALIAKTERAHAAKPRLSASAFADQTAGLAVEQRMVRSETLFLMGAHGEVEDEEAEAEHSHEIQEGRLENRGQADLRLATRLMSAAERSLLVADTGAALPSQRAALAAMQRALSKQRYFLRTLPVRSQIDPTRRLSGDLSEAQSWRRDARAPSADARSAEIRRWLADLAAYVDARTASAPATDGAQSRHGATGADANALAGRLLALDPASAALQTAARDLTQLAAGNADWSAAASRDTIARLVSAVRGALPATPPPSAAPPAFDSGAVQGALADALRREGARP